MRESQSPTAVMRWIGEGKRVILSCCVSLLVSLFIFCSSLSSLFLFFLLHMFLWVDEYGESGMVGKVRSMGRMGRMGRTENGSNHHDVR
jgi:hypothetical protein